MAFDPVPWAIGGGAEHTDELLRVAANAWSRDSEGIVLPGDLKVTQLAVPGAGVLIADGAVVMRNRQAAGQSYIGRAASPTQVNPAATGGSVRHDMIIARVIDPDFSPWVPYTDPDDIAHGPYFEPYIVSGVSAVAKTLADAGISYSGYPLCRLDIPINTSTFTNAMITDLRALAQPRIGFAYDLQAVHGNDPILITDTAWRDWPTQNSLQVTVPRWATHAMVSATIGFGTNEDACDANVRVKMGNATGPSSIIDHNATGAGWDERFQITAYAEFDVTGVQEDTVTVKTQAQRTFTMNTGTLYTDVWGQVAYDIRFSERAV